MAAVDNNSMGALCTAWHNSWYASLVPVALDVWIFLEVWDPAPCDVP